MSKEKFKVYEGVFDQYTIGILENLKRRKYYDELGKPIKMGKEAVVYSAKKDYETRAIKLYRVTSANFKKISEYIQRDFRFKNVKGNVRKAIMMWVSKEFRNLLLCHKAGMNVPIPYKFMENVLIMEYIDGGMLKDTKIENPKEFFHLLLEQLYLMKNEAKLIHGDLSEFNILVRDQVPVIIDLGQAMTIKNEDDFNNLKDLYERDIKIVVNYFNRIYNLKITEEEVFAFLEKKD
ncbi:MAG: RIO1 family regulatory kinase/ATPase [Nanoarchaeota archaeon]